MRIDILDSSMSQKKYQTWPISYNSKTSKSTPFQVAPTNCAPVTRNAATGGISGFPAY